MEVVKEITEQFKRMHTEAIVLGLYPSDIYALKSLREIKEDKYSKITILLGCLISFMFLNQALDYPITFGSLLSISVGFMSNEIPCLVEMTDPVESMLRPPIRDCSFCKNLTHIPKVSNISKENFNDNFSKLKHPVVIVDVMDDWKAREFFTFSFIKNLYVKYGKNSLNLPENDGTLLSFKGDFETLEQLFTTVDEHTMLRNKRYPWYMGWNNGDGKVRQELRKYFDVPYFLTNMSKTDDWIFMGSPGYGATLHIDNVLYPSWQGQIRGMKKWTLQPPPECYFECPISTMEVTVNEGEMIVLDTNYWYHKTLNVGTTISISIGSEYDVSDEKEQQRKNILKKQKNRSYR